MTLSENPASAPILPAVSASPTEAPVAPATFAGMDLASDPAQLDPVVRTNYIFSVREAVFKNEEVPDAALAFALRCVRLTRAEASRSRPSASGAPKKEAAPVKAVTLSDF